jgi:ribosomal protein S25
LLVILSLIIGGILFFYNNQLIQQADEFGCYPQTQHCIPIERTLSINHLAIGVFSFIFALGFYLLFFSRTEKAILEKLESNNKEKFEDMKFEILMKALDPYEQKVIKAIREQEGITQSTLRIRTDMSKAKLSYVLQELEKRGIIKRVEKGKTLQIFLKI